ncbi:unnamed protein product [Withania somnifera]
MARPPFFVTSLCTRQNANSPIRYLCIAGCTSGVEGEFAAQNPDLSSSENHQSVQQSFVEIAKDVCKVIRTRPRWEKVLLSDFPNVNFTDPRFYTEVLKEQKNALLLLRFYHWLSSQTGFLRDKFSDEVVFSGLVQAKAAIAAKHFRRNMNVVPQPSCLEAYIQCLLENGLIEDALDVFNELRGVGHCPSLKVWNSALSDSIRAGRTDIVWKLYEDMTEAGVVEDVDTIGLLIQAFCMENNVPKGHQLLRQVLEAGHAPSRVAFNKLIYLSCKNRDYLRLSALLHSMIATSCYVDIFTYQHVIQGLCETKKRREAFRIFNVLKNRGYAPDIVMYTTMINGLCKMKLLGDARKLWFEMIQKGFKPNQYTYNTLIHGYLTTNHLSEAESLYRQMCDIGYGETTVTYNTMIYGLCLYGRVEEAHNLFNEMAEKGVAHDVVTYNSLIQGLCKNGKIAEGLQFLYELLKKGLQPSPASYTVLIKKLCEIGRVLEAKSLWNDMQYRGIKPAVPTHDYIILGLIKQGYVTEGLDWLRSMMKSSLRPTRKTLEKLVYHLSQADKLDDSLSIIDYMLRLGHVVRESIFCSLVNKLCKDNSHHIEMQMGYIV